MSWNKYSLSILKAINVDLHKAQYLHLNVRIVFKILQLYGGSKK